MSAGKPGAVNRPRRLRRVGAARCVIDLAQEP
jgi:hypothetical protein